MLGIVLGSTSFAHGYITIPELLWTILGFIGVVTCYDNLHNAIINEVVRSKLKANGELRIIAMSHIRGLSFRFISNMSILAIGVFAMAQPPVKQPATTTPSQIFITICFFIIVLVSTFNSVLDRRTRRILLDIHK